VIPWPHAAVRRDDRSANWHLRCAAQLRELCFAVESCGWSGVVARFDRLVIRIDPPYDGRPQAWSWSATDGVRRSYAGTASEPAQACERAYDAVRRLLAAT
jgi:hypothetical protein